MSRRNSLFADRLRFLREAAGLSIPQLAAAAGLARQTIHLLEQGKRQPSLATAARLSRSLRVNLSEFA